MKDEFRAVLAERAAYELRPRGRYRDTGMRFTPPHADKPCPHCGTDDACCGTKSIVLTWEKLGLYQEEIFGSPEWAISYNRRSHVEGFFGSLKSPTVGRHSRNTARFFEYAKAALAATFAAVATNLHLLTKWHADRASGKKKRHRAGRPRTNPTLATIADNPEAARAAVDDKKKKRRKSHKKAKEPPPKANALDYLGAPRS
jgi:hypothetical protein